MPNYQNALSAPIFKTISKAADTLELESYVIGGFVRDYILKRGTAKDIDVVAVGSGIALARKVSQLLPNQPKVQVFKTYGTAMLRSGQTEVEFVGARKNPTHEIAETLSWKMEACKTIKIVVISQSMH